ncbi:MAG: methanogenesis marker 16 metalloprotein [Candidatus Methanoplasma sp.]|jgi:putative methanogenesis marker 16 metalloprotein|nr:methanogenesis marker 16 metalloprotein [Candidatus Methanoplasma sp.]
MKDIDSIQSRISEKKAKVYTASEFKKMIRSGDTITPDDVDAVTCGTFGVMSGTMMILTVPVAATASFKTADRIELNGVPGNIGPCPNESLGIVDCTVYGTAHRDKEYGGGHLFRDIAQGNEIEVKVWSDGKLFTNKITKKDLIFARMVLTRGAFKNYTCFFNESSEDYETIFSAKGGIKGGLSEATVSGCGEINPLQNDPEMRYIRPGASVLLNGSPGMVIGMGSRGNMQKPNLSIAADVEGMIPEFMGGFRTSEGPECLTSVAFAIPVTDKKSLEDLSVLDEGSVLPLADAHDRVVKSKGDYSSVWRGTDWDVTIDTAKCIKCQACEAEENCPTNALGYGGTKDDALCMSCGYCASKCPGGVFSSDMGSIVYSGKEIPITLRQSSRLKGEELCSILKGKVTDGNWNLRVF